MIETKDRILAPSLHEHTNVSGRESYQYYRKNCKYKKKLVSEYRKHAAIINEFWGEVGKDLVNNEGGVYIEKFGYFCVSVVIRKILYRVNRKILLFPQSNNNVYFPVFIPDPMCVSLRSFNMDRTFTQRLVKKIKKNLRKGFKYRSYYSEIYNTFLHKYRKYQVKKR